MIKRTGAAIGAAVLVWGLAACGLAPPAGVPATTPAETTDVEAAPSETASSVVAPSETASSVVAPSETASSVVAPSEAAPHHPPLPPLAAPAPGPRPAPLIEDLPGPDRLIGLSSDAVTAVLGAPEFRRREAPAEMWRYRGKTCFLDFFLYRDGAALRVAHVEARGHDVAVVGEKACYLGLLVERSRAKAL